MAPSRPAKSYWVQVGSYRDPQAAADLVAELSQWMPAAVVGPITRGPGPHAELPSRVVLGPFPDRDAAVAAIQRLSVKGIPGRITERRD
jgi:cell division protein FtsN